MGSALERYVPERAVAPCMELIRTYAVHLKIVNERVTRHGDYRALPDGSHQITVNAMANKYRFLITLVHEIAHLLAFERFGRKIKPHGAEWKRTFQHLMLPFLRPEIFPPRLLPLLARHFRNPRASSSTDTALSLALREYDPRPRDKQYVFELPEGSCFRLYNGRIFRKGPKKIKRYQCVELNTGKLYLFQPQAEVEWLSEGL
jgi:hypothetical protein